MPSIITAGAASARGFGFGIITIPIDLTYYIATITGASTLYPRPFVVSGNLYIVSKDSSSTYVAKISSPTSVSWSDYVSWVNGDIPAIAVDSSQNVYIVNRYDVSSQFSFAFAKTNSSGTIQWQLRTTRTPVTGTGTTDVAACAALDSSGNLYVGGQLADNSGIGDMVAAVIKIDPTGSTASQVYTLGGATARFTATSIYVSSAYFYVASLDDYLGYGLVSKVDSSTNAIVWTKYIDSTAYQIMRHSGVVSDSSGNVYVSGAVGSGHVYIIKYNSSGTLQWQRRIALTGIMSASSQGGIKIDSSGFIYLTGYGQFGGTYYSVLAKYDSTGSLQWQRTINTTSYYAAFTDLSVTDDAIYATAQVVSTSDNAVLKIPKDGTRTGSYTLAGTTWVYSASSFTESASSYTEPTNSPSGSLTISGITSTSAPTGAGSLAISVRPV